LFSLVTTDAGNTSKEVGAQIRRYGYHCFGQVKSGHGEIYAEALRRLRYSSETEADAEHVDTQNGQVVTYHTWQTDLSGAGWLDWSHARQIVRVQRTAIDPETGEARVGNRALRSCSFATAYWRRRLSTPSENAQPRRRASDILPPLMARRQRPGLRANAPSRYANDVIWAEAEYHRRLCGRTVVSVIHPGLCREPC
jgi:hypothetical protein